MNNRESIKLQPKRKTTAGRKLALNALIDQHPQGPAYRLKQILDETPPMALDARPVQISKDMLLRKAMELSKYVITGDYLDFAGDGGLKDQDERSIKKDVLYNHQSKIIKAKNEMHQTTKEVDRRTIGSTVKDDSVSPMKHGGVSEEQSLFPSYSYPPHQLISSLRQVFGVSETSKESNDVHDNFTTPMSNFIELARLITEHQVFHTQTSHLHTQPTMTHAHSKKTTTATTATTTTTTTTTPTTTSTKDTNPIHTNTRSTIPNMEAIISNACYYTTENPLSSTSIDGLLISTLSILTGNILEQNGENDTGLQVSGPLSTVHTSNTFHAVTYPKEIQSFQCDEELIQFLKQSVIAYEESIQTHQNDDLMRDALQKNSSTHVHSHSTMNNPNLDDCSSSGSQDDDHDDEVSEDHMPQPGDQFHESRRSEQSSSSSESSSSSSSESSSSSSESSSNSSNGESSHSGASLEESMDDDNDSNEEEPELYMQEEYVHEEESDEEEDSEDESSIEEEHEDTIAEHEEDTDDLMEQALALSLNELNLAIEAVANERDIDETTNPIALSTHPDPGSEPTKDARNEANLHLPSIPSIPASITVDTIERNLCSDGILKNTKDLSILNPSSLFDFGRMRSHQVLIQILSVVIQLLQQRRDTKSKENEDDKTEYKSIYEQSSGARLVQDDFLTFHLVVAMIHILCKDRENALQSLCNELISINEIMIRDTFRDDDPAFVSTDTKPSRKSATTNYSSSSMHIELSNLVSKKLNYIQLLSSAIWMTVRILRLCLQIHVSSQKACNFSTFVKATIIDFMPKLLSSSRAQKTDELLTRLCLSESNKKDTIASLMPITLFIEAVSLWGEISTEIFALEELCDENLKLLVDNVFFSESCSSQGTIVNMEFPWSNRQENTSKLIALCRRLRSSDVLERIVSEYRESNDACSTTCKPSNQIKFLTSALIENSAHGDMESFESAKQYLFALSAKCNSKLLLRKSENVITTYGHEKLQNMQDPSLVFDKFKIAESISSVSDNGNSPTVTLEQRAHKVWGSAISSKRFEPRSGLHQWAVRLDSCERGHVFIGVSTKEATNLKTYIGGDANGWGLIGTKALWHWKRKIRNNYGKTFRTGDIVICSLDTDAGTLSYSIVSKKNLNNLDQSVSSAQDTYIEDFGIAFEGLPRVSFSPSVGLYERHDRVTIMPVTEVLSSDFITSSKQVDHKEDEFDTFILEEAMNYVSIIIEQSESLSLEQNFERSLLDHLCECVFASLALIPTNLRIHSGRLAFNMLPLVSRQLNKVCSKFKNGTQFHTSHQLLRGEWRISVGSTSSGASFKSVYNVQITNKIGRNGFRGFGTCRKGSLLFEKVEVYGFCWGNSVHFLEEWPSSGLSRIARANLDLDEKRFYGSYINSNDSESGHITGIFIEKDSLHTANEGSIDHCATKLHYLVHHAYCHLVGVLTKGQCESDFYSHSSLTQIIHDVLKSSRILQSCFETCTLDDAKESFNFIKNLYSPNIRKDVSMWYESMFQNITYHTPSISASTVQITDDVDEIVLPKSGRNGAFSMLSTDDYTEGRKSIICVFLHHLNGPPPLPDSQSEVSAYFIDVWEKATSIVEDVCRIAVGERQESAKNACSNRLKQVRKLSEFLLQFDSANLDLPSIFQELKVLYTKLGHPSEMEALHSLLHSNSCLGLLKYFGVGALEQCFVVSDQEVLLSHMSILVPPEETPLCYGCIKRSLSKSVSSIYFLIKQKLLELTSGEIQFCDPYLLSLLLSSLSTLCFSPSKSISIYDETVMTILQYILKYDFSQELKSFTDAEDESLTVNRLFEEILTESYHSLLQVCVRVLYIFVYHQTALSSSQFETVSFQVVVSQIFLKIDVLKRDDEEIMKENILNAVLKQCDELAVLCERQSLAVSKNAPLSLKSRFFLEDFIETLFHSTSLLSRSFIKTLPKVVDNFIEALLDFVVWSPTIGTKSVFSCILSVRILRFLRSVLPNQSPERRSDIIRKLCSHLDECIDGDCFLKDDSGSNVLYPNYLEAQEIISLLRYGAMSSPDWKQSMDLIVNEFESPIPRSLVFGGLHGKCAIGSFVLISVDPSFSSQTQFEELLNSKKIKSPESNPRRIIPSLKVDAFQAGIISWIDCTSSACEVILVETCDHLKESHFSFEHNLEEKPIARAIRVPLVNLFIVDEVPFVPSMDSKAMSSLFHDSLKYLSEDKIRFEAVLTIKSLVAPLTNTEFLEEVANAKDEKVSRTLEHILALGNQSRAKIQELSMIEDSFWHMLTLRNVLTQQCQLINSFTQKHECEEIGYLDPLPKSLEKRLTLDDLNLDSNEPDEQEIMIEDESETENIALNSNAGSNISSNREEMNDLREAAILQMTELGLPRAWCHYALRRVGGVNIEAAIHFILEHGGDMERLISESESETSFSSQRRNAANNAHLLQQLIEMGFPQVWCAEAVTAAGQNLDQALTWILTNSERLSSTYRDPSESSDNSSDDNNSDKDNSLCNSNLDDLNIDSNTKVFWPKDITCPLRTISGEAKIDYESLRVTGTSSGGFTSIGTEGICLRHGKWYYEVVLETCGCIQIGWADSSFADHCKAEKGDGCGDGPSSWAYDGWRRYRWHGHATEWGCRWQEGDVVGCYLDLENREIGFTLNGKGEEIGMGAAFLGEDFRPCGGVYACVSFNNKEKLHINLGGPNGAFRYGPPNGFNPLGNAVVFQISDKEKYFNMEESYPKSFVCDFSYGEHAHELFSWQHRYFGSDASVQISVKDNSRRKLTKEKSNFLYQGTNESEVSMCNGTIIKLLENELVRGSEIKFHSLSKVFRQILNKINEELERLTCDMLNVYSQKIILLIIAVRTSSLNDLIKDSTGFWKIFQFSCSSQLDRGESGILHLASEALSFSISGAKNRSSSLISLSRQLKHEIASDESDFIMPKTLSLSTVMRKNISNLSYLSNGIEMGILNGGFNALVFLKEPLLDALLIDSDLLLIIFAFVRTSLVELSNVDCKDNCQGTDSVPLETEKAPDARLICFLTGIIVTHVSSIPCPKRRNETLQQLFHLWSIGLLSKSMPWRMICTMTLCSILNLGQEMDIADFFSSSLTSVRNILEDIGSSVARRIWAERASFPICSRYLQSNVETACCLYNTLDQRNICFKYGDEILEDATTPTSLHFEHTTSNSSSWEQDEGWLCSDRNWHVWFGTVEYFPIEWTFSQRTATRSLLDSGEGPPFLREGCTVIRGPDWDDNNDADGYTQYAILKEEYEKQRREKKQASETNPAASISIESSDESHLNHSSLDSSEKNVKVSKPVLPTGRVMAIESWGGIRGVARRIKWDLTGEEGVYRYGGDGGYFDIIHVKLNRKGTKVVKEYLRPETVEECAVAHGFGQHHIFNVIFRVLMSQQRIEIIDEEKEYVCPGIMEWPDFGAGISIELRFYCDGAISITEQKLVYGSNDSGWESRFGVPSYCPGTVYYLTETKVVSSSLLKEYGLSEDISIKTSPFQELLGSTSFRVNQLKNPKDGSHLRVGSELRLVRSRVENSSLLSHVATLPYIMFDHNYHAGCLSISRDGRAVSCNAAEGRGTVFANVGFSKGIHYWEVKIDHGTVGGIFIGVAEKPKMEQRDSYYEVTSQLNRWVGFGYVNHRSAYTNSTERVYGSHAHSGDVVGVCLDCDAGRLSFFIDGVKYGEHILNDMGCAFENISPFGFNSNGCGSGGGPKSLPRKSRYDANGKVRCATLWPVVGLRFPGDKVTITQKWMTSYGNDAKVQLRNCQRVDKVLRLYTHSQSDEDTLELPDWLKSEAFHFYERWCDGLSVTVSTRGSHPPSNGLRIDVDTSPFACAVACAFIGSKCVLLPGDKIRVKRSHGQILELQEEAIILGAFENKLWYRLVSQKGGESLSEGGNRAWFFDECDDIDQSIEIIRPSIFNKIPLNLIERFKCPSRCGIEVIYHSGAVMRPDVEICSEATDIIGTIPVGTFIPEKDVLERRRSYCGVTRYLVKYQPFGQGWISSRIRGGNEEPIIRILEEQKEQVENQISFNSPHESASVWFTEYLRLANIKKKDITDFKTITTRDAFDDCIGKFRIGGLSMLESDSLICRMVSAVANSTQYTNPLDCPLNVFVSSLFHGLKVHELLHLEDAKRDIPVVNPAGVEAVVNVTSTQLNIFPPLKNIICRASMIFALNRRFQYAIPFFSLYSPQENSSVLGGLSGYGASIESTGKSKRKRSRERWVEAPSFSTRLRECRNLLFNRIKRDLMDNLIATTTTPTVLSHDEYEIPRDIKTVRVNRIKARQALSSPDKLIRKKNSVFGQLQQELQDWNGTALRRSYIAKGHGGQKRAFKVKLIGEGVNDYSGPYREVFADAFREAVELLGICVPSPNNSIGVGDHRNLYIFSYVGDDVGIDTESRPNDTVQESIIHEHFSSLLLDSNEQLVEAKDSLRFLGKLVGTAVRHGIQVDLDLPLGIVWKPLCEENVNELEALKEIDLLSYRRVTETCGSCVYKDAYAFNLLRRQQQMLNYFADGLSSVLPVEYFSLFTAEELRDFVCGNYELDIDLLKRVVEYEGYTEHDKVITYFWSVLREMTHLERKLFLQFTWARSRLPLRESDFDVPFTIQKDTKSSSEGALPSASTCFFTLILPEYEEKETLRQKLLFAIHNVKTMDSDFVTNEAEINEGWRVFNQ